jgi:Flp pilus assembly protein TadD/ketosteroid isomerase-like protein
MTTFPDPRAMLATLLVALLAICGPAFADDVEDAAKMLKSGQHQQAMERVNKVLAAKPRDARARFLKGLILAEQGNAKDATDVFLALTKDYPDLPEPYNNLAVIYASQGQYDKARGALEQSIRTHPSYATAYENLGDVYAKLASQAYDKALQYDSANPAAKNKLALVRDLVGGAGKSGAIVAAAGASAAPKEPVKTPTVVAAVEPAKPAAAPKEPVKAPAAAPAAEPVKPAAAPKEAAKAPAVVAAVEPAKPAAEKPAPSKAGGADVIEAVNAWAKAWSAKDVDRYLTFYAKDFKSATGEARAEWEKGRRQRIIAPKSISVTVDAPKVTLAGDNQATVTFRQGYRSDARTVNSTKTLVMARADGRWLIKQERVGN